MLRFENETAQLATGRMEEAGFHNRPQPLTNEQVKLVESYMDFAVKVGQLAFNGTGGKSMDDDLVQETFLALMHSAARYDAAGEATFKTFAYRRVQGAVIDEVKRRASVNANTAVDFTVEDLPLADRSLPTEDEIIDSLDLPATIGHIKTSLERLVPTQRDIIVRHFLGGEAISAIAEEQGVSFQAINQRKNIALNHLAEGLGEAA